jgi:hypothetical protein
MAGYEIVILSDLLHFFDSHDVLVSSIEKLLVKREDARVYVGVRLSNTILLLHPFTLPTELEGRKLYPCPCLR